jgi:hypothetical protein
MRPSLSRPPLERTTSCRSRGAGGNPLKEGLVASVSRPGGKLASVNFFTAEPLLQVGDAREHLIVLAAQRIVLSLQRPRFFFGRTDPNLPSFEIDPDLGFGLPDHSHLTLMRRRLLCKLLLL